MKQHRAYLMAALAWPLLVVSTAGAATYIVDQAADDATSASHCTTPVLNECSLREAIMAANANAGADTIRLPNVTLSLTIPRAMSDDATSGDLDVTEEVLIEPQLGASPVVDAGGATGMGDRIFHFHAAAGQSVLRLVSLRNGYRPSENGGAIAVDSGASVAVEGGQITGSAASSGGAIYVPGGASAEIVGTQISGNTASPWSGGGIAAGGTVEVSDAVIRDNVGGASGGGISANGVLTVVRTEISGNQSVNTFISANGGGLVVNACGSATLTNVTISGNAARGSGGGIAIPGHFGFCPPGVVTLNNVTLAGNTADAELNGTGDGGGIWQNVSCPTSFPAYCAHVENSIIAGNRDGTTPSDCAGGQVTSDGYNMIDDGLCPLVAVQSTDDAADPGLDPTLAANDNGWTVVNDARSHGLIAGSPTNPSVDSANPATCASTDQRGVARVDTCDRGAFEADVCGNGVVRDPEQCDPSNPLCTTQCRLSDPQDHNTPFVTDPYRAGLVLAYEACTLPAVGLTDSVSGKAACNVVPFEEPCDFQSAASGSKGLVEVTPQPGNNRIVFRLRLLKMQSGCIGRQFRMRVSLDQTVADCDGLPDPDTDSCTIQRTLLDDVVHASPNDYCTVDGNGDCDYTVYFTPTSPDHQAENGHRTAISLREVDVIDAESNKEMFVPGVLLK